jgi:hypothetical protein
MRPDAPIPNDSPIRDHLRELNAARWREQNLFRRCTACHSTEYGVPCGAGVDWTCEFCGRTYIEYDRKLMVAMQIEVDLAIARVKPILRSGISDEARRDLLSDNLEEIAARAAQIGAPDLGSIFGDSFMNAARWIK